MSFCQRKICLHKKLNLSNVLNFNFTCQNFYQLNSPNTYSRPKSYLSLVEHTQDKQHMLSDCTIKFIEIYKTAVGLVVRKFPIIFPPILVSKVDIIYQTYNTIMI